MIMIDKGPEPSGLRVANEALTKKNLDIFRKYGSGTKISSAKAKGAATSADTVYITADYRMGSVKAALVESHHGKCAYCETRILSISHGDVEHFRPKSKYSGGAQEGMGYFWLAYDWRNLFLACDICNETFKGTYFELMPAVEGFIDDSKRLQVGEDLEMDLEEDAVLIDPAQENPRAFISFDPSTGMIFATPVENEFSVLAARVGKMVIALGLNRADLVVARLRHVAFIRSMFILVCQELPNPALAAQLQNICRFIEVLKGAKAKADGLSAQKALQGYCESIYASSPRQTIWYTPKAGENAVEAMRWLAFSVSPLAEYAALAQDCIQAWCQKLTGQTLASSAPTMTIPPSSNYTATVDDRAWPPIPLVPVGAHLAALQASLDSYVKSKEQISKNILEAARQMHYNDLNELVDSFNKFHSDEFDAAEAPHRYLGWLVDLEVLNNNLRELDATGCQKERAALYEWLDARLVEKGRADLPDIDRDLAKLWDAHKAWRAAVQAQEAIWSATLKVVRLGRNIAEDLAQMLGTALRTAEGTQKVSGSSLAVAPLTYLLSAETDLALLSPEAAADLKHLKTAYNYWCDAEKTDVQSRNAWMAFQSLHAAKYADFQRQLEALRPQLNLKALLAVLNETTELALRCEALISRCHEAGKPYGSWRMATLNSMRNALLSVEDARDRSDATLLDAALTIVDPVPTGEDPAMHNETAIAHAYVPAPPLNWYMLTEQWKLRKFHERRTKLKSNRALTSKQQAELSKIKDDDKRVGALIAKLRADIETQRASMVLLFDGDDAS